MAGTAFGLQRRLGTYRGDTNHTFVKKVLAVVSRVLVRGMFVNGIICSWFFASTAVLRDYEHEKDWATATPVRLRDHPSSSFGYLTAGLPPNSSLLATEERLALDAVIRMFTFDLAEGSLLPYISPFIIFEDSMLRFEGYHELVDGWNFLSLFFTDSHPIVQRVARTKANALLLDMATVCKLRFTGQRFTFKSTLEVHLSRSGEGARTVGRVTHRWFGGPTLGLFGLGEALRGFNAQALSLVVNRSQYAALAATRGDMSQFKMK